MNGEDRRVAPRAPIELRVEYKRLNPFFADYTKNISHGGTFIGTDRPLDIGTDFVFDSASHFAEPLVLKGKVQWIVPPHQATEAAARAWASASWSELERERMEATVERLMIESCGPMLYQRTVIAARPGDAGYARGGRAAAR